MSTSEPSRNWSTEELLAERAWLRALARRLVRGEAERDDLAQETWVAALRWPLARSTNPRLWLGAVLRNRWRFERRTAQRRVERERAVSRDASVTSAAELAERAELQRLLVGAVLALAEPHRSTVLRRYFGGLSSRAIARQDGVPEGTVRGRLKRALDQVRAELDRHHGGDRERWVLALAPLAKEGAMTGTVAAVGATLVLGAAASWWAIAAQVRGADAELSRPAEPVAIAAPVPSGDVERETGREVAPPAFETPSLPTTARESVEPSSDGSAQGERTIVRVLDPEDAPITGAKVTWWQAEEARTELTDDEGRAVLPVEREGGIELLVEAAGFFPDRAKRGGEGLTINLLRVTELAGRVLDPGRTPISDALVRTGWFETRSDSAGHFRLEGIPVDEEFGIESEAPGYPVQGRSLLVRTADPEPLELVLDPGLVLTGEPGSRLAPGSGRVLRARRGGSVRTRVALSGPRSGVAPDLGRSAHDERRDRTVPTRGGASLANGNLRVGGHWPRDNCREGRVRAHARSR